MLLNLLYRKYEVLSIQNYVKYLFKIHFFFKKTCQILPIFTLFDLQTLLKNIKL